MATKPHRLFLLAATIAVLAYPHGASAQGLVVSSYTKISSTSGGLIGPLHDDEHFGKAANAIGDLDGDGINDVVIGAFLDNDGGPRRGAVWILFLNSDGSVKDEQKISDTAGNFTGGLTDVDEFGIDVAALGDLDGDGIEDIVVGAHQDNDGANNAGAIYLLFLDTDGTVKSHKKLSATDPLLAGELEDSDTFGTSVDAIGDLDGDGITEIAVGADTDADGGGSRGAVYVLFLDPADWSIDHLQKISSTAGNFGAGLIDGASLGAAMASLEDLDGDGVEDIAVGARKSSAGSDAGAVWVLLLNSDGTVKSKTEIADGLGGFPPALLDSQDNFAVDVDLIGDLDLDGVVDVVVGAAQDDDGGMNRGAAWVLLLNADGTVKDSLKLSDTVGDFGGTLDDEDQFGVSAASLGDLDGNGYIDLVVGARGDDDGGSARGAAWVLFLGSGTCGDAVVDSVECCDFGSENGQVGSLCSSGCACLGVCTQSSTSCITAAECPLPGEGCCGNGTEEGDEECDDGNLQNGDCCRSDCTDVQTANCVPACPSIGGPQLLQAASMKAKFDDKNKVDPVKDGDGQYERWKIGRKGSQGDFNLDPGQHTDCRQQEMEITFIENNLSNMPAILGSFILDPGVWQLDNPPTRGRIKPSLVDDPSIQADESCKLSDRTELNSNPPGVAKAQWKEKGVKVKYRFQGKLLGAIDQPMSFLPAGTAVDSVGNIRACVRVGGSAGHSLLACTLRKNGAQLKCQSE